MKRIAITLAALLLMAAPCFGQCSSGSCGMGGMAAASGMSFRPKPVRFVFRVVALGVAKGVKATARATKRVASAGVQALPRNRRPYYVATDSPLYKRELIFRPGPFGGYVGRERFVPVKSPNSKHNAAPAPVERSGKT